MTCLRQSFAALQILHASYRAFPPFASPRLFDVAVPAHPYFVAIVRAWLGLEFVCQGTNKP